MANRHWVSGGTGNYNSTTNWSASSGGASGASIPTAVDDVFFDVNSGVGAAIINVASICRNLNLTGFTGAFTFTSNLSVNGTVLNLGTGGYTVTGTGFLIFANSNNTFSLTSNGTVWTGNMRLGATSPTLNLADNLSVTGNLQLTSNGIFSINSNTIFVGGNLTILGSSAILGTSNINFNGTGTWTTSTTCELRNNVTINTLGTLTLTNNVIYNTGTITYLAGTVVTTGSTLRSNGSLTLNTNGIIWNNLNFSNANVTLGSNLTLTGTLINSSGALSFALGGNSLISVNANLTMGSTAIFTIPANQTFKTLTISGQSTINNNTLTITENLTINSSVSGTASIVYAGTGTWTAFNINTSINNNLTINTAGTLTISGTVVKSGGTFTYTAGTIIDIGATVAIGITANTIVNISGVTWEKLLVNRQTTLSSNINAITFGTFGTNPTNFVLAGNTLNFTHLELGNTSTTLPTAWSCQNINFALASSGVINGFSITINGNIVQSGNGILAGTTTFTYGGTGTWSRTGNTYFTNSFTINTAGTLTFSGGNIGGGIFTYTAGTVVTAGSTLNIRANGTTMNHGNIVWYDVFTVTNVTSLILNNQLVCLNALTMDNSQVNFSGTDGTFDVYYLNLNSSGTVARNPRLVSLKTYRVRAGFTSLGTLAFPITLSSNVASSRAIFTLDYGATINIGFLNATDINSSLGKKLYSYRGVISNSLNWAQLPTDVKPATSTFVN